MGRSSRIGTNASSGVVPELTRRLYDLTLAGQLDDARRIQYDLVTLFDTMLYQAEFPDGFRAAASLRGFVGISFVGVVRQFAGRGVGGFLRALLQVLARIVRGIELGAVALRLLLGLSFRLLLVLGLFGSVLEVLPVPAYESRVLVERPPAADHVSCRSAADRRDVGAIRPPASSCRRQRRHTRPDPTSRSLQRYRGPGSWRAGRGHAVGRRYPG